MKADVKSLSFLGENKALLVPFFQRRYVWEKSNWSELLEAFQNEETTPFLGSIILKEESSKSSIIVDGQQRLTTITILAKAIFDCLSEDGKKEGSGIRHYVEHYLYYRDNAADDFADSHIKIEHSRIDRDDYDRVIESQMLNNVPAIDVDKIGKDSGNVLLCYQYYYEKLKDKDDKELKRLFNSIFDVNKKVFVLIELSNGDINEQTIFDTINRAGIRLSAADIIKNNLFKRLLAQCKNSGKSKEDVIRIYDNDWEKVFGANQQESEIWDEERVFGNVKRNNLAFLLYCVACIKWGEDKDMFKDLENVYETNTCDMHYYDLESLILEIKEYASIFKQYVLDFKDDIEDEGKSVYFKYDEGVRRLLFILQKFGVQMFYPYILKRLKEVDQNDSDEQLLKDFRVLESFVVRRKIAGKGTHDYTSKCYSIIKNGVEILIESELGRDGSGIDDVDVLKSLHNTKDDTAKMLLFWIELYRRRPHTFDVSALEYVYTLEHIMPKKWETHWSDIAIYDNSGICLEPTSIEGKKARNEAVQSLGNKTLLMHALNSSVKNESFDKKVKGISPEKPGYESQTWLLLTKEVVDSAKQDMTWNEERIEKRTKKLWNEIVEIWPSYKTEVQANSVAVIDEEQPEETVQYTQEQLDDPIVLLREMEEKESVNETDGLVSIAELIQRVNVQQETVERYIREGKMIPDEIKPASEHKTIKFFRESSLKQYVNEFGWRMITDENRKDFFLNGLDHMVMSYSYKPVLLKAFLENADSCGKCSIQAVVSYFLKFYSARREKGLFVEKEDSVFSKENCTREAAEHVIRIYPIKRFVDIGVMCADDDEVWIVPSVWDRLTDNDKTWIMSACDESISTYYQRLA